MSSTAGKTFELIGALLSVLAGGYLLTKNGAPVEGGQSWFEALAHGIGLYFLARGAWMVGQLGTQQSSSKALERLVELQGGWPEQPEARPPTWRHEGPG
jgi:hypothetical protein